MSLPITLANASKCSGLGVLAPHSQLCTALTETPTSDAKTILDKPWFFLNTSSGFSSIHCLTFFTVQFSFPTPSLVILPLIIIPYQPISAIPALSLHGIKKIGSFQPPAPTSQHLGIPSR